MSPVSSASQAISDAISTHGAQASRQTARARTRAKAKRKPGPIPTLQLGRANFRFTLVRTKRRLESLVIDPWVDQADWQRNTALLQGTMTFRTPVEQDMQITIATGDEIRCDVSPLGNGAWQSYWQMNVTTPQEQIKERIQSLTLATPGDSLTKSKVAWKFRANGFHPGGWTADQITRQLCQRFHFPVGILPKAKFRIRSLVETSASPYDVIVKAWKIERRVTGRRYDIKIDGGLLTVSELRHPPYMLQLADTIIDATITRSIKGVVTALDVTGSRKVPTTHVHVSKKGKIHETHGHKTDKIRAQVIDPSRDARYGYIVKTVHAPKGVASVQALRAWAQQQLANHYKPQQAVAVTFPGIPFVDRGDSLRINLPQAGYQGDVFIETIDHSITAGSYICSATIGYTDPTLQDQKTSQVLGAKGAAAARRGRHYKRAPSLYGHTKPAKSTVRGKHP